MRSTLEVTADVTAEGCPGGLQTQPGSWRTVAVSERAQEQLLEAKAHRGGEEHSERQPRGLQVIECKSWGSQPWHQTPELGLQH